MDKKLFDKCLSVVKSRIRKLTMDKSNIQIAIDNYRRDYEKALKQLMKLHGLDGAIKVVTNVRRGNLVLVPTEDVFVPYRIRFETPTHNSAVWIYNFDKVEDYGNDLDRYFIEAVLPYIVKESA